MKIYVPNYYKDFSCIAGACKHNCCIGWEIDIDADTYSYYKAVPDAMGERLKQNISEDAGTPHFVLDGRERCPFLNAEGLCDIITELGENALCQICADHPRFRNFYEGRTELGLGMCCEAAAELILIREEKAEMVPWSDDGEETENDATEAAFFVFREKVLSVLQDRAQPMEARIEELCDILDLSLPRRSMETWIEHYLALEQLDDAWTARLLAYKENAYTVPDGMLEQLLCYFIYRHMADGIYDGTLKVRIAFALHAARFICALAQDETDFVSVARMYSAEIEYSQENTEMLLKLVLQ